MVAIPVVLKKPVKSRFGVNPVLYQEIEEAIVVVVPPDARPSISPRGDTGCLCHIGESAVAIIAIERVFVPLPGRVFSGNIEVDQAIVVIVAPRNASSIVQRSNARWSR